MEEKILDAISQIRPFLQRDGGDIEFVELTEDNIVKVRLQGALVLTYYLHPLLRLFFLHQQLYEVHQ